MKLIADLLDQGHWHSEPYVLAIDFDGTITTGSHVEEHMVLNPQTAEFLAVAKEQGWAIVLWTCREGDLLEEAVEWCTAHGIEFDAVNENVPIVATVPGLALRKIYYDILIDDRCLNMGIMDEFVTKKGKRID